MGRKFYDGGYFYLASMCLDGKGNKMYSLLVTKSVFLVIPSGPSFILVDMVGLE